MAHTRKVRVARTYSAGEHGRNRVRAFEQNKNWYVESWVPSPDGRGLKRARQALGRVTPAEAKKAADRAAAALAENELAVFSAPTLGVLFDIYVAEKTKEKRPAGQLHDARCIEMFSRYFGRDTRPTTLSRPDFERFVRDRRSGAIRPASKTEARRVGERVIGENLAFLNAVFNWATAAGDGRGGVLLERNPLKGFRRPRNENPKRPLLTSEQYEAVLAAANERAPWLSAFVQLTNETGHRSASVRQLKWSDVDLEAQLIHWRPEIDKTGYGHTTPLSSVAVSVLKWWRAESKTIGASWIFPSIENPSKPFSTHAIQFWWRTLRDAAGIPAGERYGWHSFRRKFATEMKRIPLKDLAALGGWRSAQTILTCYMQADLETQRTALEGRRKLVAGGLT